MAKPDSTPLESVTYKLADHNVTVDVFADGSASVESIEVGDFDAFVDALIDVRTKAATTLHGTPTPPATPPPPPKTRRKKA